jgi:hypothetical protein
MLPLFFFIDKKGIFAMLNGPLSDRIDCILEKPMGDLQKPKSKQKSTTALTLMQKISLLSKSDCKILEASRVNCPNPPRSPDHWIL